MSDTEPEGVYQRECKGCGRRYKRKQFACDCGKWTWIELEPVKTSLSKKNLKKLDEMVASGEYRDRHSAIEEAVSQLDENK